MTSVLYYLLIALPPCFPLNEANKSAICRSRIKVNIHIYTCILFWYCGIPIKTSFLSVNSNTGNLFLNQTQKQNEVLLNGFKIGKNMMVGIMILKDFPICMGKNIPHYNIEQGPCLNSKRAVPIYQFSQKKFIFLIIVGL